MNSPNIQAVATLNLKLSPDQEQTLLNICVDSSASARKQQGYDEPDQSAWMQMPRYRSWMWWRVCALKSYEHDYSWRESIADEGLWKKSNKTLSLFETQVEQHFVEIKRTMLRSSKFFVFNTEGWEDDEEGVRLAERRLQHRSKQVNLKDKGESAVIKAMLCGECIIRPTLSLGIRPDVVVDNYTMMPDGSPLKTSNGSLVPFGSKWHNDGAGKVVLSLDETIILPADLPLRKSDESISMTIQTPFKEGAQFEIIDHRDFKCDPRWSNLNEASYKGHEVSWTYDQLTEFLSGGWDIVDENLEMYREDIKGTSSARQSSAKSAHDEHGEDESEETTGDRSPPSEECQGLQRLSIEYVKADILGLGRRQDIFALRDIERNKLLAYTYTRDTLSWLNQSSKDEYIVMRSAKVADRWYGSGYFKDMYDDAMGCDELNNWARLEIKGSGNASFLKPSLVKGGKIKVRGTEPNILDPSVMDFNEVFGVVQIPAAVSEINDHLQFQMGRVRGKYGQITPGSSDAGLEGMDTAFGMNLVAQKGNAHLDYRQGVLTEGLDKMVETFASIELRHMDLQEAVDQMGREEAMKLVAFIEANKDDFTDVIETLLANANNVTALAGNIQALELIDRWIALPDEFKEQYRRAYVVALLGLDVRDPDRLLVTNAEALAKFTAKLQALNPGQSIAPPGGPGAASPAFGPLPVAQAAAPSAPPVAPGTAQPPRQPPSP